MAFDGKIELYTPLADGSSDIGTENTDAEDEDVPERSIDADPDGSADPDAIPADE